MSAGVNNTDYYVVTSAAAGCILCPHIDLSGAAVVLSHIQYTYCVLNT